MPPKRKSDAMEPSTAQEHVIDPDNDSTTRPEPAKKARLSEPSSSKTKGKAKGKEEQPSSWQDVVLETNDDGTIPVYDDCAEVRRKIRQLTQTPGFKITHWLKDIGNINNNSYNRFMKEKGRTDGASNGTYYAAYVYFEKVRIAQGKKKTAGRKANEEQYPFGFPLENRRKVWVITGR
ncbi:hypothetical protein VNI00_001459 [Paramarasmius palmivorus]|uniref:DUF7726 domain-containing protein n=1 Tax=Paramarasmius palmivorus TaxID=297713 RepID=A0AAW0E6I8_9AGAR